MTFEKVEFEFANKIVRRQTIKQKTHIVAFLLSYMRVETSIADIQNSFTTVPFSYSLSRKHFGVLWLAEDHYLSPATSDFDRNLNSHVSD